MKIKIAIDGPSGAGKSTLAKNLATELGLTYVDTGAMYRGIGLYIKRKGIDPHSVEDVSAELCNITIELKYEDGTQHIVLCGEDVSGLIRTGEMGMYASAVSAIPAVRSFLFRTQRDMCDRGGVVMDGRDIGTVIMPDADVKLFIVASPEARARRRYAELQAKGEDCSFEDVLADIKKRDANDSGRDIAPAIPAEDAIYIDNSDMEYEETLNTAINIIKEKCGL